MIQTQTIRQSLASAGNQVLLDVNGLSSLIIELTGTFVGTTVFEYTINGTDWYALTVNVIGSSATATGATAVGKWIANVAGFLMVRIRCTAYTSGTISVAMRAVLSNSGSQINGGAINTASSANTPSIATAATAIAANAARKGWMIQNVGQNPLFVRLGADASATVFHAVLKGGTADTDGLGASLSQMDGGVVYTGIITIAGTSPKYVVTEL